MKSIIKKELIINFNSLYIYYIISAYYIISIFTFFLSNVIPMSSNITIYFSRLSIFLPVFTPLLIYNSFNLEYTNNSYKILFSIPIKTQYIVLGKYSFLLIIFIILNLIHFLFLILLGLFSKIYISEFLSSFIGYSFLFLFFTTLNFFIAAIFKKGIVSVILSILCNVFIWLTDLLFWNNDSEIISKFLFLNPYIKFDYFIRCQVYLSNIIYFVSFIILFIILSIIMLKIKTLKIKNTFFDIIYFFLILTFSILLIINIENNDKYNLKLDFTFNKATSLSENSIHLKNINKKVNLYTFKYQKNYTNESILLDNYNKLNSKIEYENIDLRKHPDFITSKLNENNITIDYNTILVLCNDTKKYKVINDSDLNTLSFNIETGNYELNELEYEKNITEAIDYVTSENNRNIYILNGHGESYNIDGLLNFLNTNQYKINQISIVNENLIDNSLLIINSPTKDITNEELANIKTFMSNGGSIVYTTSYEIDHNMLKNLNSILKSYGITVTKEYAVANENNKQSYYKNKNILIPYYNENSFLNDLKIANRDLILMPYPIIFNIEENSNNNITQLIFSSGDSINNLSKEKNRYILSALSEKSENNGKKSKIVVFGNTSCITEQYLFDITFAYDLLYEIMNNIFPENIKSENYYFEPITRKGLIIKNQNVLYILYIIPLTIIIYGYFRIINRNKFKKK